MTSLAPSDVHSEPEQHDTTADTGASGRPAARRQEDRSFPQLPLVSWFRPLQIGRTALRVVLSQVLTKYLDRRETQAGLPIVVPEDAAETPRAGHELRWDHVLDASTGSGCHGPGEVWVDYVADVGDGWDATYTTAMLVGQSALRVPGLDETLPRADMLVLGGDLVYPTPSRAGYRDRLRGPLEAALPELPEHEPRPWLFAIPGNHDWYDGLTHFLRVFCQGASIGAWRTRQTRSYFAVKLPGDWAIWGCDIQLDTRIDPVQMAHFRTLAKEHSGGRVILCSAKPSWIEEKQRDRDSYLNYWYFLREMQKQGASIPVSIAGDLHHYIRYTNHAGNHKITAGGGGSYLQGTHDLPRELEPPPRSDPDSYAEEKAQYHDTGFAFPDRVQSRRLSLGVIAFPLLRRSWHFCLLLGVIGLALVWTRGVLDPVPGTPNLQRALSLYASGDWLGSAVDYWRRLGSGVMVHPVVRLVPLGVLAAWGLFCALANFERARWLTWPWGLLHGALHVSSAATVAAGVAWLGVRWFGGAVEGWTAWEALTAYAAIVLLGGLAGGSLMGIYLAASDRWLSLHTNEAFSAQAIPDYRCFLRMRIRECGELTIFPIGVRWAPREWRRKLDRVEGEPYHVPHGEMPRLHLIEGPIVID